MHKVSAFYDDRVLNHQASLIQSHTHTHSLLHYTQEGSLPFWAKLISVKTEIVFDLGVAPSTQKKRGTIWFVISAWLKDRYLS